MNGDGPGQPYRVLRKRTQFFFIYFIAFPAVDITDILPGFFFKLQIITPIVE
jgi:hypothetical protein